VSIGIERGLWREVGADRRTFHPGWTIRARNRSILPRPYIWRLTSLSFVTCPSVWPLDQGSTMAAFTASSSA